MERIMATDLGEVILLTNDQNEMLRNLMPDFGYAQPPVKGVLFHGMIGVYDGLERLGTFMEVGGQRVNLELKPKHVYELALIDQGGVVVPFIRIPMHGNCMVLQDRAYIGPEEISAVLKEKCGGNFQKFFADYARVHRKVETQQTW